MGENIACKYLRSQGFYIKERNFQRKWGELDIIAQKDNVFHFFEVKSVTNVVSQYFFNSHQPEDNVDGWKIKHLRRMIETYYGHIGLLSETPFQFHIFSVYMNMQTRRARIKWLKDIIL